MNRYRLIEALSEERASFLDLNVASVSLVEDDDGMRLLLSNSTTISGHAWVRAHSQGAGAIVCAHEGGLGWISVEKFIEYRQEDRHQSTYSIDHTLLSPLPATGEMPSYRMLYNVVPAPAATLDASGFVHLHAHSEYSPLDGLSTMEEMASAAAEDGQEAVGVTDHGYCSGHPSLQEETQKRDLRPIFGMEGYFVPNRHARGVGPLVLPEEKKLILPEDISAFEARKLKAEYRSAREQEVEEARAAHKVKVKKARDYNHMVFWAMNMQGLRNVWALSSLGFLEGFYGHPRVDWESLEAYSEGVMCSTACLKGVLAQAILRDDEAEARTAVARLLSIFGDRLYFELHTNHLEDQIKVNAESVRLAQEYGVPTVAVVDSHYCGANDAHTHRAWLALQTASDLGEGEMFQGHQDYHFQTLAEVHANLSSYLPADVVDESIKNTVIASRRCDVLLKQRFVTPVYSKGDGSEDERRQTDRERAVDLALKSWHKVQGRSHSEAEYMERFETEAKLLSDKGFWGYYLQVADQVAYAKKNGKLVGPGRGSGAGSLIAYLMGITGIDPVENGLLFERFLTEGREEPPDFDVDYPSTARDLMQDYCTERWGADYTIRVGTHSRMRNKGVFEKLQRLFKDETEYSDFREIAKIIDAAESGEAGLGLKWDDLWDQHGEVLEPYREKYPRIFELAERMVGRLHTYGKHAAGMVISTDEKLSDHLPVRTAENSNQPISQFDMDALTFLGYIKFDILTLRTLDTLQMCIDLIEERHGVRVDPWSWGDEQYLDPQVWDEICAGHTKGIFQIETPDGTRMTTQFQPRSVAELSDVITLVRPGPKRSGLTDSYLLRKEGRESVSLPDPRLAEVLEPTYGCIIYQEQVMKACQVLGGYSLNEADAVRKILGKKKVDKVKAAGEEFIERCTANGMAHDDVVHLWEQLGEFAKYSFNKSHAFAYAQIGYWTAWFKFFFPVEFLTAALSTVKKERVPEFIAEARRMEYGVLPPDINESGVDFTPGAYGCRFGFQAVDKIGEAVAEAVLEGQPYKSFDDFLERRGSKANKGHIKTLAKVGVFDSIHPHRRALVEALEYADSPESTTCQNKNEEANNHGLPCNYNWDEEPVEIGKRGRPKKRKPPPKRCTRACRQYTPPVEPSFEDLEPYTDEEIRALEAEFLGVWLSSTPFDIIPEDLMQELRGGDELGSLPPATYATAVIVKSVKKKHDRHGNEMAFVKCMTIDTEIDITVFKDAWGKYQHLLKKDALCLATVRKNHRGLSLEDIVPI